MRRGTCFLHRGTVLTIIAVVAALVALPGCPSGGGVVPILPGSSTIESLISSDAVVGGQGRVRLTLVDVVSQDTTVSFASSSPSIVTIPDTATIPAGGDSVEVAYNALAIGQADVTATLNANSRIASVQVVGANQVRGISISNPLLTGISTLLGVSLNARVAADTAVSLSSSNPAVLAVPSTIVVPPFESFQNVSVTAGSPGTTTITAALGSSTVTHVVTVVASPSISNIVAPSQLLLGTPFQLEVTLNTNVNADTAVSLSSSNSAVLAVPAAVTVPAGSNTARLTLTPAAAGSTIVTASINGSSQTSVLTVMAVPSVTAISLPSRLQTGVATTLTVFVDTPVAADSSVSLTSSNPAVLPVPASVTIPAGQRSASVVVTPVAAGSTLITASLGTSSLSQATVVVATSSISSVNGPERIQVGSVSTVVVNLSAPVGTDTPVTFTSSDPAVLAVSPSSTIPAGSRSTSVPVQGVAVGTANVQVTVLGGSFILPVRVVAAPAITAVSAGTVNVGQSAFLEILLDAIVAADTTITLTNSAPTVVEVPSAAVVPAGEQRAVVSIVGLTASPPDATVTATLGVSSSNATITVLP